MSHRELPRSGRGCVSAVVLVPLAALGGVLALVLTFGVESEDPVEQGRRTDAPARPTLVSLRTTAPGVDDPAALIGEPPERRTAARSQAATPGASPPAGQVPPGPGVPEAPGVPDLPGLPDVPFPTLPSASSSVVVVPTTSAQATSSATTPPPTSAPPTAQPPATSTPPTLQPTTSSATATTPQVTTVTPTTTA
ncbi:hypothetical protein AB0A74_03500 [Saccharothrix sp. NPDC042600]|uniref:hypothetical protein n=1 Tax=Saccharothrix TaxID=2071 RepID=UPI0033C4C169|nr:hypothetical protein GCM10017745_87550 [Saccharothrix mutabilis subsp. capreolus]